MPHRRTPEKENHRIQIRAAREYVITMSYNDYLVGEKVCRSEPEDVQTFLCVRFGVCDQSAVPSTFKGVVISDGRGNGEFQK